jgi:hypothetical protein
MKLLKLIKSMLPKHNCSICEKELSVIQELIKEGHTFTINFLPDRNSNNIVTHWHFEAYKK